MASTRANEKSLETLHGALCSYFLKLIDGQIPALVEATVSKLDAETGETTTYKSWVETGHMLRPTAGEVAVMAKFLKDNAITGPAIEGGALSELDKKLAQRQARRGAIPNARDVKDAIKELGSDLLQ